MIFAIRFMLSVQVHEVSLGTRGGAGFPIIVPIEFAVTFTVIPPPPPPRPRPNHNSFRPIFPPTFPPLPILHHNKIEPLTFSSHTPAPCHSLGLSKSKFLFPSANTWFSPRNSNYPSSTYYSDSDSDGYDNDYLPFSHETSTDQGFPTTPAASNGKKEETPKKYHCAEEGCGLTFFSEEAFHEHLAGASDRHKYCIPCRELFRSIEELQNHLIRSSAHIACSDCFKEFKSQGGLSFHKRTVSF